MSVVGKPRDARVERKKARKREEESVEQGNGERHFYDGGGGDKDRHFFGRFPSFDCSSF